jgi:hypothetical protein
MTSPRTFHSSPTTPRIVSPFPRTSPTFFTSRSSRSTRSSTPNVQSSASPEVDHEAGTHVVTKQTVRTRASSLTASYPYLNGSRWQTQGSNPEAVTASPRPASAPTLSFSDAMQPTANITVIVTEPPQPSTTVSTDGWSEGYRAEQALRLRPELCMPEPLCTMELMTPSVYEPSPVEQEG